MSVNRHYTDSNAYAITPQSGYGIRPVNGHYTDSNAYAMTPQSGYGIRPVNGDL